MARIYDIQMTRRQKDLVISMIQILVDRLQLESPIITYSELAEILGTSYRKLGMPLLKMSQVIRQCPVNSPIPSLNALVVYSTSHLPARNGLLNAEGGNIIENDEQMINIMNDMNLLAREFQGWPDVIRSIVENSFD